MYFQRQKFQNVLLLREIYLFVKAVTLDELQYGHMIPIWENLKIIRRCVPIPRCVSEYYLCIFFLYKHAGWIGGKGIGTFRAFLNALHSLLFPLPAVTKQRRIVTKIKETAPFLEKYEQIEQHLNDLNVMFREDAQKSVARSHPGKACSSRPIR